MMGKNTKEDSVSEKESENPGIESMQSHRSVYGYEENAPKRICQRESGSEIENDQNQSTTPNMGVGMAISEADIDRLIKDAEETAAVLDGSDRAVTARSSQGWLGFVKSSLSEFFTNRQQLYLGEMGELLSNILFQIDEELSCRPRPMGRVDLMFSSSTFRMASDVPPTHRFLVAVTAGLDSMHGVQAGPCGGNDKVRRAVQKRLGRVLSSAVVMDEPIPLTAFSDFFSTRGLDYRGEEVKLAKPLTWEGVEPSLPAEVGTLDVRDFCDLGILHYINNFEDFLVPMDMRRVGKAPRVIVEPSEWPMLARGLVRRGICEVMLEDGIYHLDGKPLMNGMFAVSKDEFQGEVELLRLIMNLKPCNDLCRPLEGDTSTLPMITSLGALYLDDNEVLMTSSEDIRCFFYLFSIPESWKPYMCFAKEVPLDLLPVDAQGRKGYLTSRVLPMGFLNSVGIAQRIHRNVVRRAMGSPYPLLGGECELRRDRPPSSADMLFRVYLDNFDLLKRVSRDMALLLEGKPAEPVLRLCQHYDQHGLPSHPKKSTKQALRAEVQGAWVDGVAGTVSAKASKMAKYIGLILQTLRRGTVTQRELQVLGGGMVYMCMFRRPLLCSLNHVWRMITALGGRSPGVRVALRREVAVELVRFLCLAPLASMSLRAPFDKRVSVSDASMVGGGVCVSRGLSSYGVVAASASTRGDVVEPQDIDQVLSIGLFDGIGALRVALDVLGAPVAGHISVEKLNTGRRVLESFFPDVTFVEDIEDVTEELILQWSLRYSSVALVLIGAGPPCQGVSGLNWDRRGALRDCRSSLFQHVPWVVDTVRRCFPWAQVHFLGENVASMDPEDCAHMNSGYGTLPWLVDAEGISLCRRPRLYWITWELASEEGATVIMGEEHRLPLQGRVELKAQVDESAFLEPGWSRYPGGTLPTFTTSRPSAKPGRKPAGLASCKPYELARWRQHKHRYPPYQYRDVHCVHHRAGAARPPSITEREAILGFPIHFTKQCLPKAQHESEEHSDTRLTLLGNTWSIPVVCWLLSSLLHVRGFIPRLSVQDLVQRLTPGCHTHLQGLLQRPPMKHDTQTFPLDHALVQKLSGLTSQRGEDLLVQGISEPPVRYQRLRGSIPGKLWRWRTVTGWRWRSKGEHINVLELRAVYTTVKWRILQLAQMDVRCVHLVDSLVVLHSLSRGRSSSRRLRRTLMKLNALLLATGLQPVWAYIDTKQNPADKPSRWGHRRKWVRTPGKS